MTVLLLEIFNIENLQEGFHAGIFAHDIRNRNFRINR